MKIAHWPALAACAVLLGLTLMLSAGSAGAVNPDEILKDPKLEARARELSEKLRCVVCQNQTIDESNAPLAHDLRVLVRERLTKGDSDEQALGYIVTRYGNFVLLKPPLQGNTLLLWFGPAIMLILALLGFGWFLRERATVVPEPISADGPFTDDEKQRLKELLNRGTAQ
jgi:cytochrome c-type biogenesis protein CcmH